MKSTKYCVQSRTAQENTLVLISAIERLAMSQPKTHFVCPMPFSMHPQAWLPLPHALDVFSKQHGVWNRDG